MNEIPVESKALNYVQSKGWQHRLSGNQINVKDCPYCGNSNWKFYLSIEGNKDGLWDCKVCTETGNLWKLMESQGDRVEGLMSMREMATLGQPVEPLPNIEAAHKRLMEDEDALDYCVGTRGFSIATIEKCKLGVETDSSGTKWLVIPYFLKGNPVFVKKRTLPPAAKDFRGSKGREAPLFNEDAIHPDMDEIIFVEGEPDCLSCLSNGIEDVVGVPGANLKKTVWIKKLDECSPKKVYILYDRDKVGQQGAKELAQRIGLEKCYNILLPEFTAHDGQPGKDINDWFRAGHTLEEFDILKRQAKPFDVEGVTSLGDAITELEDELLNRGTLEPTLTTPWPSLNKRLGGAEWGDVVGVIAEGKVGKTTMCMNWLDFYVGQGIPCLMYCLEMLPKRLARKWCSFITETDDTPGRSQITLDTIKQAKALALERAADFYFAFGRAQKREQVFDKIRQAVRRYGVKVVCFDNLQLLCRSIDHAAQETAVISRQFKELATELGIVILLVVQPNRVKDGDIVGAKNALGSSSIEKDVDSMVALHRKRIGEVKEDDFQGYMDTEQTFEPQMMAKVDLNRYGPGGICTLWMEGQISKVREINPDEINNLPKFNVGAELPVEQQQI
jgi:twinkle protein